MKRTHTHWLTTDIAKLRELYPKLGAGCTEHFPGRTAQQIRSYAAHLGLKCDDPQRANRIPREKALAQACRLVRIYSLTAEELAG